MSITKPRIDLDIWPVQQGAGHGVATKDLFVFHETVSGDVTGLSDVIGVSNYLGHTDHDGTKYGIHGVLDSEGNLAWCLNHSAEIFYHCSSTGSKGSGTVNTRGIGLELVSNIPVLAGTPSEPKVLRQTRAWARRQTQLYRAARILEWQSRIHRFPLRVSEGATPGVTTHWQVTMHFGVYGGHTDCFPRHRGGYFPLLRIIAQAKLIRAARLGRR